MADFATLVLGASTAGLKAGEQALDDIAAKGEQTEARTEKSTQAMGDAYDDAGRRIQRSARAIEGASTGITRGFRLQGGGARMLTQQLSQVGQMYVATGNAGQAIAVQAADIGLAFGAIGTAVGTVAGLVLPALIAKFGEGKSSAEQYADALENLEDAHRSFSDAVGLATTDLDELREKYGENAEAVRELYRELVAVEQVYAMGSLREVIREQGDALDSLRDRLQQFSEARVALAEAQQAEAEGQFVSIDTMLRLKETVASVQSSIQTEYGLTTAQAYRVKDALDAINSAQTGEQATQAARQLASAIASAANEGAKLPPELAALAREAAGAYSVFVQMEQQSDDVGASINWATDALRTLLGMGASDSWLDGMISSAGRLAQTLWGAANAMAVLRNGENLDDAGNPTEFGSGSRARTRPKRAPEGEGGVDWGLPPSTGGGGGGGAASLADQLEGDLDRVRASLQTQREEIEAWREESLTTLIEAREREMLKEQEYRDLRERLEAEHRERLMGIRDEYENTTLGKTEKFFGDMASAVALGGSKTVKAARVFGAAEALINAYVAGSQVLRDPKLPWYVKIPAATSIIAAGIGFVDAIKSGSKSASGGVGAGSSAATSSAPAEPLQTFNFTVTNDPFGIGENMIRQIVTQMNEASRNGINIRATVST